MDSEQYEGLGRIEDSFDNMVKTLLGERKTISTEGSHGTSTADPYVHRYDTEDGSATVTIWTALDEVYGFASLPFLQFLADIFIISMFLHG